MKKLIRGCVLDALVYQPGQSKDDLDMSGEMDHEICKLASNENPLGPSPLAVKAVVNALTESHLYPDNTCSRLIAKVAATLHVSPEKIAVGNGSTDLIHLIGVAFLNPGEVFLMSRPSFAMARMVAQIMDCRLVEIPLKDYHHDFEAILEAAKQETKIVYIDNPINPIGTMMTQGDVERFMDRIPEDVVVIFDEAYREYVSRQDYPETLKLIEDGRHVILLRTFSKLYGLAGLRVGYCVSRQDFAEAIRRVVPPFSVNRLAQLAAAAALDDQEHVRKTRAVNDDGKKFLYDRLDEMSVFYIPSEANFVTIDVKTNALRMSEEFLKTGVIVRPLNMYGLDTFLRVTIGLPEQNKKFVETLKQIRSRGLSDSE
jgi:histidinol-phosphate aminotransferase